MKNVSRYSCGNGEGMFYDKKGYWIEYDEYKKLLDKYNSALTIPIVSGSADYWSERCKLAETCIEESPCDPDITNDQIKAWSEYHNFIKTKGQKHYR